MIKNKFSQPKKIKNILLKKSNITFNQKKKKHYVSDAYGIDRKSIRDWEKIEVELQYQTVFDKGRLVR